MSSLIKLKHSNNNHKEMYYLFKDSQEQKINITIVIKVRKQINQNHKEMKKLLVVISFWFSFLTSHINYANLAVSCRL